MTTNIQQKRDTAGNWTSNNPVLLLGQVGWEGVNGGVHKAKIGDGSTAWNDLPYSVFSAPVVSVAGKTGAVTLVKGDVGLANVDNTADSAKPVSIAQQAALDLKANLASPALTGNPTAPTPATSDDDTSIATTAYVQANVALLDTRLDAEEAATTSLDSRLDTIEAGWDTYVPVWTAATTNPVLNNGTIVGRYKQTGKTVRFRVVITMGGSTTYGSGQYSVSLPVAAHGTGLQVADSIYFDGQTRFAFSRILAGATVANLYTPATTAGAADRLVTNLVPFTWASTNVLIVSGTYEAA